MKANARTATRPGRPGTTQDRCRAAVGRRTSRGIGARSAGSGLPLLALILLLLLALFPASAGAFTSRVTTGFSPITGSGTGVTIHTPKGIGLDQATGNVFLNDGNGENAVDIFGSEGGVPTGLASPYQISGLAFNGEPSGVAVDNSATSPSKGALYVVNVQASPRADAIRKYTRNPANEKYELAEILHPSSGASFNEPLGVTVDSHGNVYVADYGSSSVVKFSPTGTQLERISTSSAVGTPSDVAVDSAGDLFVAGYGGGKTVKFPVNGSGEIEPSVFTTIVSSGGTGLAMDRATNTLFLGLGNHVAEYNASTLAAGNEFGYGVLESSTRVVVNESNEHIYVADNGGGKKDIAVFGEVTSGPDAGATLEAPGTITGTTAQLNAKIDDNSALPTAYQFEISTDGVKWTPAGPAGSTPGNQSGYAVTATATGLTHKTKYFYRIAVSKAGPASAVKTDGTANFTTATILNATVELQPATNITATSAELHAKVTDNGPTTTIWRFQYSSDGGTTWDPINFGITSGNQSNVAISAVVNGLVPNTNYKFRVVTSKGAGSDGEIPSSSLPFKTIGAPPIVSDLSTYDVSNTSAKVVVQIDPRHSDTAYVVEYGSTPALGHATEAVDIGEGVTPSVVSRELTGLEPTTSYYYRVVATNLVGPTASPTQKVTTRAEAFGLPQNRAYEQVTPVDKGGNDIDNIAPGLGRTAFVGESGEGVSYCAGSSFGADPAAFSIPCAWYAMRRTPTGWQTRPVIPQWCTYNHDDTSGYATGNVWGFDANVDAAIFYRPEGGSCPLPPLDPNAPTPAENLYKDNLQQQAGYQLLSTQKQFHPTYGGPEIGTEFKSFGGSNDYSHVVFSHSGKLTPDAPEGAFQKLYDYSEGENHLVSIKPDGSPFMTSTAAVRHADAYNGISTDGSRILFSNPPENIFGNEATCESNDCQIYMREDDSKTVDVSESECTEAPCPSTYAAFFGMATPDTSKVWFTSSAKLTDDDTSLFGRDLYMYTNSPEPEAEPNLTLLSKDNEPSDGTSARVQTVIGSSDDGDIVYFVAEGQIVPGESTAEGYKIYRWQWNGGEPSVEYLFSLPLDEREAALNWFRAGPQGFFNPREYESPSQRSTENRVVSDDGKYLEIMSFARLLPAVDYDETVDYYRWGPEGLVCVSCQPPGMPSNGDSFAGLPSVSIFPTIAGEVAPRGSSMSANGKEIFFNSSDALVPQDENGTVQDVYEWDEGTLSLISSGRSQTISYLLGVSHDASNVFFVTKDKLVGWDTDNLTDIYDAHVGGGFPEPEPEPAPCEGEACVGQGTSAPSDTAAGTHVFEGPPNRSEPAACLKGYRKVTKGEGVVCQKKKTRKPHQHRKHHSRHHRSGSHGGSGK